jgi:hypothetical protein
MRIILEPILQDFRAIYQLNGVMERYWAYVHLMTKARHELLPIGDFSPMGKRQKEFLDFLIEMRAEDIAREVCEKLGSEIESEEIFRVMLVVVDEPANGWTQRFLSDADWRFCDKIEKLPKPDHNKSFDRWVSVNIWTTDDQLRPRALTSESLAQHVRGAIFRAHLQRRFGYPTTLAQMIQQEGTVMRFAGESVGVNPPEIERIAFVIDPLKSSLDFPTNFAALYGDDAAISVGYQPLGLPPRAGFSLGYYLHPSTAMGS